MWGKQLWGYFFLCGRCHFSPRRGHFLHVVGLFFRMFWGVFLVLPPPPWQFFCGSPYCCHIFFTSQIFIFFQIVEVSIFWGNLFFSFLGRGGGALRGWSTFEHIYIVSQGACRARGVGYRVMIIVWETEMLTMGGGWAEVIYFSWCWGGGGGAMGEVFLVDRITPSKNSNLHDLERL